MDVRWVFFDVGSTLVDETEAYDYRAREMIENTDITFSEFDDKRIELAKLGFDGNSKAIEYFRLKKHLGTQRMRCLLMMRRIL